MGISRLFRWLFQRKETGLDLESTFSKGAKVNTVQNAHGRFGYSSTNPVPVEDQKGQIDYLACLRCPCGEPFAFHRIGSFGSGPDGHVIDGYEILCRTRKHKLVLFMDMYHSGPSDLVPDGLTRGEPEGIGLPFHVKRFPHGLADAFKQLAQMHRESADNDSKQSPPGDLVKAAPDE